MVPVSCVLYTPNFQDEITGTQHTHGRIDRSMPAGKVSETKHSRKNTNIESSSGRPLSFPSLSSCLVARRTTLVAWLGRGHVSHPDHFRPNPSTKGTSPHQQQRGWPKKATKAARGKKAATSPHQDALIITTYLRSAHCDSRTLVTLCRLSLCTYSSSVCQFVVSLS